MPNEKMPIYFYWGEDDFAITKAVKQLQSAILDRDWLEFNFHRYSGDRNESVVAALNEAMTPPFGMGGRLVWLSEATICQQCSADLLTELSNTLPKISDDSHLLFTTSKKPDGRLKSTKLINKVAEVKEFNLIPFWDERSIKDNIYQLAAEVGVKLAPSAVEIIKDFVGNDTRQLWNELEKLSIYQEQKKEKTIEAQDVSSLVICNTQNSLKLAEAIRDCKIETALVLITELLDRNEPALKIVSTLVRQFRMWATIKAVWESGKTDYKTIAKIAEIGGNPNRIKYMLNDLKNNSATQLLSTLPLLLELEYSLKRGAEPQQTLKTTAIKMCNVT